MGTLDSEAAHEEPPRRAVRSLRSADQAGRHHAQRRAGILAAVRLGVDDAHHEGLDRRVSLIAKRA